MAKKIENEQVVNRFLLSTVYALVAAIGLYFLEKIATGKSIPQVMPDVALTFMQIMIWGGLIGLAISVVILIVRKKFSAYYPVMFAVIALAGAFMRYGNLIPSISFLPAFDDMHNRIVMVATGVAVLYIYELVVYFLLVNKVEGQNNKKKKAK